MEKLEARPIFRIRDNINLFADLEKYGFTYCGNYYRGDNWQRKMDGIDIEKLIEALRHKCEVCKRQSCNGHYWELSKCPATIESADALTALLAENAHLRKEREKVKRALAMIMYAEILEARPGGGLT